MTLDDLSRAWSSLRNVAFGRSGNERHVSEELGAEFTYQEHSFRTWLAESGPLDEALAQVRAAEYVTAFRRLESAFRAEGLTFPNFLAEGWVEQLPKVVAEGTRTALVTVIAAGLAALALGTVARARRGRHA